MVFHVVTMSNFFVKKLQIKMCVLYALKWKIERETERDKRRKIFYFLNIITLQSIF